MLPEVLDDLPSLPAFNWQPKLLVFFLMWKDLVEHKQVCFSAVACFKHSPNGKQEKKLDLLFLSCRMSGILFHFLKTYIYCKCPFKHILYKHSQSTKLLHMCKLPVCWSAPYWQHRGHHFLNSTANINLLSLWKSDKWSLTLTLKVKMWSINQDVALGCEGLATIYMWSGKTM